MDLKLKKRDDRSWWVVDPAGQQVGVVEKGQDGRWYPSWTHGVAREDARSTSDRAGAVAQIERWLEAQAAAQKRRIQLAAVGVEIRDDRYWYGSELLAVKVLAGNLESNRAIKDKDAWPGDWHVTDGLLCVRSDSEPEAFRLWLQYRNHDEVKLLRGWQHDLARAGVGVRADANEEEGLLIFARPGDGGWVLAPTVEKAAAALHEKLQKQLDVLQAVLHGEPVEDRVNEKED